MVLSSTAKQIIYPSASLLYTFNLGMMFGYPAILTPALLDKNSDLQTDKHTASWIASLTGFSGLITVFLLGPIMHVYGRRTAHLILSTPMLIGWIIASVSYSIPTLIAARLLQGMGNGGIYFCSVCIGELTAPKLRGVMLNMKLIFVSAGIGCTHLIGCFFSWRTTALVGVVPVALSMLIALFWPENPEWLVSQHKYKEAEKAFFTIRDNTEEAQDEIKRIIERENTRQQQETDKRLILRHLKMLKSPVLWRPVTLLCCAVIIPEAGGRHFIPAYSVEMVKQISNDDSKGFLYTCIIDMICILSSVLSTYLVARYPRRHLGVYGGYCGVVILVLASIIMYVRLRIVETSFLMVLCLSLFGIYFCIVFSTSFGVCYLLMGELLPLEYRPLGTVMDGILANIILAIVIRLIPILETNLGVYGMFILFSAVMTVCLLYMHYDLPETKDRTLHDIGEYFRGHGTKMLDKTEVKSDDSNEPFLS